MTARALVLELEDAHMGDDGFRVYVHFLVDDPATYPAQQGVATAISVRFDPTATHVAWRAAVIAAVIEAAAVMPQPFTIAPDDVTVAVFG